ncbi:expressed unknown protein [Seminavis robusta]|uniref:Uncharacterized protein n=1 Tax=Seminavis robusta TaxID=568900 RepID=A0A9N8HTV2_9STRA|nr:expressed unknown protein [Seminavis robusta]|eukprot:Sro1555_g282180.1 n/a (136) ;mRNA; r:22579-22986
METLLLLEKIFISGLAGTFLLCPHFVYSTFFFLDEQGVFAVHFCMNIVGAFMLVLVGMLHNWGPTKEDEFHQIFFFFHTIVSVIFWKLYFGVDEWQKFFQIAFWFFPFHHAVMLVAHGITIMYKSKQDEKESKIS